MKRRTFLQVLAGGAASLACRQASWSAVTTREDDFFIFIHAGGGWDVTLWADPRNERKGLIEPPSSANTDVQGITHWQSTPLTAGVQTFRILEPPGSSMRFGPAIGSLYDLRDRLTIINGIAMSTVSHDDGTVFSATGRHKSGGIVPQASIDVMVANELGTEQLMPDISVRFPSYFVGRLDQRVIPLRVSQVESLTRSFDRSPSFLDAQDRHAISVLLSQEAREAAKRSTDPEPFEQLASQQESLDRLLGGKFSVAFSAKALQVAYPQFNYRARFQSVGAVSAAFALEAIKRNLVRCVGFNLGGLDTHTLNYRQHARTLQELFDVVAALLRTLDETPHPTLAGSRLSEHTHILVISEFCRTPQITLAGGRDHYPNNSALVISPRFRAGQTFGRTDPEQLLPAEALSFTDGRRALTPADLLATFLGAFAIDPRRYLRDGEVVKELLA